MRTRAASTWYLAWGLLPCLIAPGCISDSSDQAEDVPRQEELEREADHLNNLREMESQGSK